MSQPPSLPGVEHRYVEVDGVRFHVAEAGEGEPIVCLHGWPQHWWAFRKVIPGLAGAGYRVIVPDLRGFGWSDVPADDYRADRLADDVIGLLDALGLDRVRLVGHDWGGYVGFLLGIDRPERFSHYLALNTIHPWPARDARGLANIWRLSYQVVIGAPGLGARLMRTRRVMAEIFRRGVAKSDTFTEEDIELFVSRQAEPERARAASLLYRTALRTELAGALRGRFRGRLRVPTLFLHGADDRALHPVLLRGYEEHADDMRLELVEGYGHFIAEEGPEIVLERALRFFGNL